MVEDVVPSLLAKIRSEFEGARLDSERLKLLGKKLADKKAGYLDANDYAIELGGILSEALRGSLSDQTLPDGKMYYNIAKRLLGETLGRNYELVSDYAGAVQKNLNQKAKIGIAVQVPELNQDRIDGLVNRLSSEESFDAVRWLVEDPIVNFSQSIVDDFIQKNAEFQFEAGLSPKIIRRVVGHPCKWCKALEGQYNYPDVPPDVYRRHGNCRCTVTYDPRDGKVQDVWSKRIRKVKKDESKRKIGLESVDVADQKRYNRLMISSGAVYGAWNDKNDPDEIHRREHAEKYYEAVRNRSTDREVVRIAKNTNFSIEDVRRVYFHVFENYYDLEGGKKRFDPDYDMAQSWSRLFDGKHIQKHDLTLLHHELMESGFMEQGMDYDTAHKMTQEKYDYLGDLIKWQIERGDL